MSAMQEVLSRSRAPGKFVERKRFTLSRDKAVEKLREFALRHPQQYVLELVQGAVFAGARWIAFDIEPDRLLFAYVGGRPLDGGGLANIFDYLFAAGTDPANRHMVQLAIALNAILQRNPSLVRIETGDGTREGTVRMDLDKKGRAVLGTPERYLGGTYLLVEFGGGWFDRFTGDVIPPEQALIEERCRYTPVPILLNGSAPFGYRVSRDFHLPGVGVQDFFDEDGRRGVLAVPGRMVADHEVDIVVGGVHVTSVESKELTGGPPLVGVICDDGLRKTADQSDIVRDAAWLRMRHGLEDRVTTLIRRRNRTWRHPDLPPVPVEVLDEETSEQAPRVQAEPLPPVLSFLGPSADPDLDSLTLLRVDEPLFYTSPEDAQGLLTTLDPARFPHRVLRLTEGQAITLREKLPGRSISRLSGVADADFVGRALGIRPDGRAVTLVRPITLDSGEELRARITLRAHPTGLLPGWGLPEEGPVPVLVAYQRVAVVVSRLPVEVPRVSVRVDLDERPRVPGREFIEPLAVLLSEEAWRLVAALEESGEAERAPELLASLLGAAAVPRLVDGGEEPRLDVALPPRWPVEAHRIAEHSLAEGPDGPLTLRRLVDLQGTAQVVRIDDGGLRRLDGLEHLVGFGHVLAPALEGLGLLAVGWTGRRWRWLGRWFPRDRGERHRDVRAAIVVLATLESEPELPEGWTLDQRLGAGLIAIRRDDDDDGSPAQLGRGASALLREIKPIALHGMGKGLAGGPVSERRLYARARLATMQLARFTGRLGQEVLFPSASGAAARALDDLREAGGLKVCARHGVAVDEQRTIELGLDELRVLERHLGERLALRFDDPPSVWQSLLEGDHEGWLVREEVRAPGLRGQVGLRFPFDPTSGVFLASLSALVSMPELDRAVPCHGLVLLTGGEARPTAAQARALRLGRVRLYQKLASLLVGDLVAARRRAAERYGGAYVAWQAARGGLEGSVRAMAAAIPVSSGASLADWLALAEEQRPELPTHLQSAVSFQRARLQGAAERGTGAGRTTVGEVRKRLARVSALAHPRVRALIPWLEERLGRALVGQVPRLELTNSGGKKDLVVDLPWAGTLGLRRNHPLVRAAWKGSPAARELLCVELLRVLAVRAEDPIDLPRALEALVTAALDG